MKLALAVFVYAVLGLITVFGFYTAATAEHLKGIQGGLGFALFGAALLAGSAAWQAYQRRAVRRRPAGGIQDSIAFSRSPHLNTVMSVFLALLALSFYLLDQSDMVSDRRAWMLPSGMWFFALIALLMLVLRKRIALRLSPQGLDYTPFRSGPIVWSDILGLQRKSFSRQELIVLDLRSPEKYLSSHSIKRMFRGLDRKMLGSDFIIMPAALDSTPDVIAEEISKRIRTFGAQSTDIPANVPQDTSLEAP